MNTSAIRLFQRCAYAWLIGYALAVLCLGDAAWSNAPVEVFRDGGLLNGVVPVLLAAVGTRGGAIACAVLVVGSVALIRRHRTWLALVMWFLFKIVGLRLWLASNGGIQLMENMLLWSAFLLPTGDPSRPSVFNHHLSTIGFWAARLQVLVAYAGAAAHKFTGTTWLDGTAVMRVASDPLFDLGWLSSAPVLCTILTYLTLAWMTVFPIAVWWTPSRRIVLVIGVLFHLCTAVFMGIPQMGLAFIACYPIWMGKDGTAALGRLLRAPRQ